MASIYLSLSTKEDVTKKREILIRFSHGRINQRAKTNIFIPAEYWDDKTQEIIIPNYRLMNDEKKELKQYLTDQSEKLNTLTATVQTIFTATDKNSIEPDWLKIAIEKYNFPERYAPQVEETTKTVFKYVDEFINEISNRKDKETGLPLTKNTIKQYKVFEKHLKNFAQNIRKKDFDFSDIDQSFYDKFVSFLQGKSFAQNTVGKTIKVLKTILNEATVQGYNPYAYYNSFHVFKEDADTIYLNEAELQQLKDTDFSKMLHLDRVRDWFLLLAWTGSRFSDLEKIAKTDIKDDFIAFRQQKTNEKVVIPLHPVVSEILEKHNYSLPEQISNQKFNTYIKEACRIAGINGTETMTRTVGGELVTEKFEKWQLISSHTGRRSFCTNMYKRGLPALMIMSISGHRTEKSFLKYIKVKQNEHAEMMKKAWENMYK
jgi:integrase